MSVYSFKLPDLGEGTVESEIVVWHVQIGDWLEVEQPLVDMMTDKATVEITAPVSGRVISLVGEAGDVIAVGSELASFETEKDSSIVDTDNIDDPVPPVDSSPTPETTSTSIPKTVAVSAKSNKPLTSPSIRRIAREHNLDLYAIPGTGPKGRITRADIEQFLCTDGQGDEYKTGTRLTGKKEIKVIGLRRKIAEKMALSARQIPHFTYVEEVDMTELESLRQHLNATRGETQVKLTYLPFFMQALVKAVKDFPQCNAHFDDDTYINTHFEAVHIGIATQTDNGLMVPVIQHVEALDIWQSAAELQRLAKAAKTGNVNKDELSGSTITISSLGALGGIVSTPVINHPEVSIIAVNKTQQQLVMDNGTVTARLMMNLSSSFDHRVVDGDDAARFIQALKSLLEHPATIFM